MSDRIEINFTANVREVMRGTEQIGDGLKKTERALDDVGEQGEQSLEKITKAQGDVADASTKVGSALSDVGGIAKSALEGDLGGAVEGAAQSIGGLAALIPGVGGLVGAGLGTALSEGIKLFSANVDAEAKASEDRIQSMYDAFVESGVNYLTTQQALASLDAITGDKERRDELKAQAEELGLTIETILAAQVQSGEQRNQVLQRANELLDEQNQKLLDGTFELDGSTSQTVAALQEIVGEYQKLNGEQNTAAQGAELFRSTSELITGELTRSTEEIQKANKALAETPKTVPTKLSVDDSELEEKVSRSRTVRLRLEGYSRTGQQIV